MSEMAAAADAGQPVFEVKVKLADVRTEVRVNDLPVMRVNAGFVVTEFDVNPCVWSGENTLSLIVRPRRRGESASCGARRNGAAPLTKDTSRAARFAAIGCLDCARRSG